MVVFLFMSARLKHFWTMQEAEDGMVWGKRLGEGAVAIASRHQCS